MADDDAAKNSLFGGAAARNKGKVNPYLDVSASAAAPQPTPASPPDAGKGGSASSAYRDPAFSPDAGDDPARSALLAGGKLRKEEPPQHAPAAAPAEAEVQQEGAMYEGDLQFDFEDLNMTSGAGGGGGLGEGEGDALDFDAIDTDMQRFAQDEVIKEALNRGVDLRVYSRQIDHDLRQMEMLSIADYVKEADSIAGLFEQITGCETVLTQMQTLLTAFQQNLGGISDEIRSLQEDSLRLSVKMQNRRSVQGKIRTFLAKVAVPETLIERIVEAPIDESWMRDLRSLGEKVEFTGGAFKERAARGHHGGGGGAGVDLSVMPALAPDDPTVTGGFTDSLSDLTVDPFDTAAGRDAQPQIEKLRQKAVARLRDFLSRSIAEVCKPKSNMQKTQEYALLKFAYAMTFLSDHAPDVAKEMRTQYADSVGRTYADIFKRYVEDLSRMAFPPVNKADVIANCDPTNPGAYTAALNAAAAAAAAPGGGAGGAAATAAAAKPSDPFSVADRIGLLSQAEAPPIVVHVAQAERQRFPFEAVFRSIQRHLMDVGAAEEAFCKKFFGERDAKEVCVATMNRSAGIVLSWLEESVKECWDCPGLLLLLAITASHRKTSTDRKSHVLEPYFQRVHMTVWPRFKVVLDANVASIKAGNPKKLGPNGGPLGPDAGPHLVTKRFAEFIGAIVVLHRALVAAGMSDDMMTHHVNALAKAQDELWMRMAAEMPKGLPRSCFLVNQYSTTLAILTARGVAAEEATFLTDQSNKALNVLVEESLDSHYRVLISYVKKLEAAAAADAKAKGLPFNTGAGTDAAVYLSDGITLQADAAEAEAIVHDFALNWRAGLRAVNDDMARFFGREVKTHMRVLGAVFARLVDVYQRFTALLGRAFPSQPAPAFTRELVRVQALYDEIRRYGRSE